ncbi:MAG: PA14 domain-containing protein [bacterium]|nr:PA14 domain-containing protein [bacterium]
MNFSVPLATSLSATLMTLAAVAMPSLLPVKELRVLVVVYRGETNNSSFLDDQEYQSIVNAVECGRLFYFRNTRATLALSPTFLAINAIAPDTRGPTFAHIEADLRQRGYVDNQFDGVFATGRGLSGNWGGFRIFDRTGAAFALPGKGGQLHQFPSADTSTGFDTAWVFVHEFQHALDLALASAAGFHEMLHGHPYTDAYEHPGRLITNPGAQHWDWIACTLRNFPCYQELPGATRSMIFARDADGDGLADYHPALPMDEARFGSDPQLPDTDGDGLSDLEEFTADIYRGSDPRCRDTDDDGLPDGTDPWPTVAIMPYLPYAHPRPILDGTQDVTYRPLILQWYAASSTNTPRDSVNLYGAWHEDALYLYARAPQSFTLEMQIDTSPENGFWIGGDTYTWHVCADAQPLLDAPRVLHWPAATAIWARASDGSMTCELCLPAQIGIRGVTSGMEFPDDTADGLRLLAGHDIAVNVAFDFSASGARVLLTPPWTMVSTRLLKTPADPDWPLLRFTPRHQATCTPRVRIDGVASTHTVTVVNTHGTVIGTRCGSGWLILDRVTTGHDRSSGLNVIYALSSSGATSPPYHLIVDTAALPPSLTIVPRQGTAQVLSLHGEPEALAIVECARNDQWQPLLATKLDPTGRTTVVCDTTLQGFRAEYYASLFFTNPVLWRVDPVIAFDYADHSPLPGLCKPDHFSIRWTGWLSLPQATTVTWFLATDDGARLYLDDQLILDHWGTHSKEEKSTIIPLAAGEHAVRVDYYEHCGWAAAWLEWQPQGGLRTNAIPVRAFPGPPQSLRLRARQVDPLGNPSLPCAPIHITPALY